MKTYNVKCPRFKVIDNASGRLIYTLGYARATFANLGMMILTSEINADLCPEYGRVKK